MERPGSSADRLAESFLEGGSEAHAEVRSWIETVVGRPGWRFSDSEGVIQEILLKILTILRSGRFEGRSTFRTFVTSVARHSCIDIYRREKLRGAFESEVPVEDLARPGGRNPERSLQKRERLERLIYIFQSLPEECRSLWRMIYGEHLTPSQIAERLGISGVTARVRVHRCLEKARLIGRRFLAAPVS